MFACYINRYYILVANHPISIILVDSTMATVPIYVYLVLTVLTAAIVHT